MENNENTTSGDAGSAGAGTAGGTTEGDVKSSMTDQASVDTVQGAGTAGPTDGPFVQSTGPVPTPIKRDAPAMDPDMAAIAAMQRAMLAEFYNELLARSQIPPCEGMPHCLAD